MLAPHAGQLSSSESVRRQRHNQERMHPGEPSASEASSLSRLYDSELAEALRVELVEIYRLNRRLGDELRTNEALRAILREFARRSAAADSTRLRYRKRHLRVVRSSAA